MKTREFTNDKSMFNPVRNFEKLKEVMDANQHCVIAIKDITDRGDTMIDLERYAKAFDIFLVKMEQVKEVFSWEYQGILDEICEMLCIGKIELLFYENQRKEGIGKGDKIPLYQKGICLSQCEYESREVNNLDHVYMFRFYLKENAEKWSKVEQEKVEILSKMLYTFNSKVRLSELAEKAMYFDRELRMPNVAYVQREIGKLAQTGKIVEYGVSFFNLKRFSVVNQSLGRELATRVMLQYLSEFQQKLGHDGLIGRAGGDNFVVLFKKEKFPTLEEHFSGEEISYGKADGSSVIIRANAGVFFIERMSDLTEDIIEKAHIAVQKARKNIERTCVVFDESIRSANENENLIESSFRDAIGKEEFVVYYQPKIKLENYEIGGAEALCRWIHGTQLIPPMEFIPVLEQSNAICTLDFYMLDHVCRDIRRWIDQGINAVKVSVNFSRRHFGDHKLLQKILEIIDKYEVPHELIEIELTETTTDVGFIDLQEIVKGLHKNGIHTSVDDFGVGYSSLNLIRQIPWDVIKIDKSFLPEDLDPSSSQYILFIHLLSMLRNLGINCVVEGVETIEQVKMLKENDCFMAQGFYFDRPLPAKEFEINSLHFAC